MPCVMVRMAGVADGPRRGGPAARSRVVSLSPDVDWNGPGLVALGRDLVAAGLTRGIDASAGSLMPFVRNSAEPGKSIPMVAGMRSL